MANSIQIIKSEIAQLEEKLAVIDVELQKVYRQYLELLVQSVQKQLMTASYQICTQAYPESFIRLSFKQRHALQNNLRQLGQTLQTKLIDNLGILPSSINSEGELSSIPTQELPVVSSEYAQNPEALLQRYQQIEKRIHDVLAKISREANFKLQEAKVLPNRLPAKVLEMAMKTEENNAATSDSPNLLNLLIETEQDDKQEANITKITAIHLRLLEIEFAEPILSNQRNQIRHLLEQLNQMRKHYQRKQRQLTIVEAEAAWRASWYED